jgi:hypothetical protein
MEVDGRSPAVVLETSPGHFQAWVRVPERTSELQRGQIARRLAAEYEADRGSASPLQFGNLAGFATSKDVERSRGELQPLSQLHSTIGRDAPDGPLLVRQSERALGQQSRELSARERGDSDLEFTGLESSRLPHTRETEREATDLCRREIESSVGRIPDPYQRDLAAAVRLAEVGYGARAIERALRAVSPDLESRSRGQIDRYVHVAAQLGLREHAHQLTRELERDRGMER